MTEQATCARCSAPLVSGAAYCDECGARTFRARRMVGLAVRIEILAVLLTLVMIFTFAWVYLRS